MREQSKDMEAFQLLARGGAKFDKKRFQDDVKLFDVSYANYDTSFCVDFCYGRKQSKTRGRQSRGLPKGNYPRS